MKDLLDGESISIRCPQDGLIFYVDEQKMRRLLDSARKNDIPSQGASIDNVFDGGFSSTEADKTKKYKVYLQKYFAEQLETLSNVESASVTLDIPNDDGTISCKRSDSYAAVILTLNGDMDEDQAAGLAKYIATQLGNKNTDNIQILDSNSNVLFSGDSSDTNVGTANSQLSVKSKAENLVKSKVKDVMVGSSFV